MPKHIPACPGFHRVVVAGVEHELTPAPRGLGHYFEAALAARGLRSWMDCGLSIDVDLDSWWPPERCPVETVLDDEDGNEYPRWPFGPEWTANTLVEEYPDDAEDIREFFVWQERCRERDSAIAAARAALEAAGAVRYRHILAEVVRDLDRQVPGFVDSCVSAHCADGHRCGMAEHYVVR